MPGSTSKSGAFGKKILHSLRTRTCTLKRPSFSDLWAAKLEVAQNHILQERGVLGAGVRDVIETFSFALQRFESFYTPLLDFLLVLPAIVQMLKP